jgi:hypothetical protein
VSLDEWAQYHKVQVIKRQSSKLGKCAEKVNVLIWGDLSPRGCKTATPIGRLD